MRTTVSIDDQLLQAAKDRARSRGESLGAVVDEGLRLVLTAPATSDVAFDPPVFHGSGVADGADLTSNRALEDLMDDEEDWPLDRSRR